MEAGQLAESEATLRDAVAVRTTAFGKDHWAVAQVKSMLGEVLGKRKKDAEAEVLLRSGYAGLKAGLADGHIRTKQAEARLNGFLKARGRAGG